ncbi:hypothetical protein [Gloeobacter violaceus]|uniref:Gsr1050 protein n=1 Tax=Gloeobacter violaceus (strain ATCC 29082 / PCC 7421) TaxID=251221 RepID=Q7NLS1_GLOVI|nr:hypothetical protein [Gloeobacter violaceus]BAC88991.1 gsr1050 [Gloeobacter violaceus PCC 7421]
MSADDTFANALEVIQCLPLGDPRVLDACRRLGEITNDLQSAMAAETDLEQACALVEEHAHDSARKAASFLIEVLRLAHNL